MLAFANATDRFAVVIRRNGYASARHPTAGRYRLATRAPAGQRYAGGEERDCAALEIAEGGRMHWHITIEPQHDGVESSR